jgi:uncharacterized protein (DUF736 family)
MNKTTNNQQTNNRKDELGALWKKKSKSGMSFLSGYVKVDDLGLEKEIKVVIFANSKKTNEKAPDYRIYVSKPLDADSQAKSEVKSSAKTDSPKQTAKSSVKTEINDEDIL